MSSNVKIWKCKACGSFVRGVNWDRCLKGKAFHATPTGGECRAVNFDQVPHLTAEAVTVPCRDQDDTGEHEPAT